MHISLDSELGRQRRLNQVGETISSIAAPTAAYSLRSLTGGDPKAVRVRRESDNHERDFTVSEVSSGALVDFVNSQVTAPLDIREIADSDSDGNNDGRVGDFLIAKAAYSLRSLGTRQATVTSSGDTDGDTSGKYVCQVRSVTGNIKSFTADEVSDGTLVDFVLGNTKPLLNNRVYFDGSDDRVQLTSDINLTGDFSIQFSFVVTEHEQRIFGAESTGRVQIQTSGSSITAFVFSLMDNTGGTLNLTENLKCGENNTVKFKRVSDKIGIYNENDILISNESENTATFTLRLFGRGRGQFAKCVLHSIRIDTNNDGTIDHSYNGYGNTLSDWQDLVGSNNASAVDGSPALFTGQDQDGFVKTWYDQSVSDQAGSATGNHAQQTDTAKQPTIVSAGSLVTKSGQSSIDFTTTSTVLISDDFSITEEESAVFAVWQPAKDSASASEAKNRTLCSMGSDQFYIGSPNSNNQMSFRRFGAVQSFTLNAANLNTPNLHALVGTSSGANYYFNGSSIHSDTATGTNSTRNYLYIGTKVFTTSHDTEGYISELIIYDSDQTDNRTAIEANMGEHYSISGIPAFDNSVNGFVETWYDQSGNGNDLTQATASKQPTIVTSGAINTRNSQPIIKFIQANSTFLQIADSSMFPTGSSLAVTIFHAMHIDTSSGNRLGVFGHNGGGNNASANKYRFGSQSSRRILVKFADASPTQVTLQSGSYTNDTDSILTYQFSLNGGTASFQAFNNGSSVTDVSASTADQSYSPQADSIILGARSNADNFSDSEFFEVIAYGSDQLSNRSAIETNMNTHYSIF